MYANVQLYKDFSLQVERFSIAACTGEDKCISNDAQGYFVYGNRMDHAGSSGYIIQKAVPTARCA